jgi:hypothetical protein
MVAPQEPQTQPGQFVLDRQTAFNVGVIVVVALAVVSIFGAAVRRRHLKHEVKHGFLDSCCRRIHCPVHSRGHESTRRDE